MYDLNSRVREIFLVPLAAILNLAAILEKNQLAPYPKMSRMTFSASVPNFMLLPQNPQLLHHSAGLNSLSIETHNVRFPGHTPFLYGQHPGYLTM